MTHITNELSITLTSREAHMLYQVAKLGELRTRFRGRDEPTYALLHAITSVAFQSADDGKQQRQETALEERSEWTVSQIARAAGLAERTVRLDCQRGELPATKQHRSWTITSPEAHTYIGRRRKN
jgi:hypothetical protein